MSTYWKYYHIIWSRVTFQTRYIFCKYFEWSSRYIFFLFSFLFCLRCSRCVNIQLKSTLHYLAFDFVFCSDKNSFMVLKVSSTYSFRYVFFVMLFVAYGRLLPFAIHAYTYTKYEEYRINFDYTDDTRENFACTDFEIESSIHLKNMKRFSFQQFDPQRKWCEKKHPRNSRKIEENGMFTKMKIKFISRQNIKTDLLKVFGRVLFWLSFVTWQSLSISTHNTLNE